MDETTADTRALLSHDVMLAHFVLISDGWTTEAVAKQYQTGQQGAALLVTPQTITVVFVFYHRSEFHSKHAQFSHRAKVLV